MLKLYDKLKTIAESEYKDIVISTKILGKRTIGSAKLRIFLKDQTYLDIWLSPSGKYSYHWEQRAQRGTIYRHDNAPDFPPIAIKQVLNTIKNTIKQKLEETSTR